MSEFDDYTPTESDYDSIYGSKCLSAADILALPGGKKRTKIGRVDIGDFRQENGGTRKKFVLYFEGMDKGMVLNATNAGVLKDAFGKNTSKWIGATVGLVVEQVPFGNKRVPGLRLRVLAPPQAAKPAPKPAQPVAPVAEFDPDFNDDPRDFLPDDDLIMGR